MSADTSQACPPSARAASLAPLLALLMIVSAATPAGAQRGEGEEGRAAAKPAEAGDSERGSAESEEVRAKRAELDAQIANLRASGDEWAAKALEFERTRREAPERLAVLAGELEALQGASFGVAPEATLEELENQLVEAEQDLATARKETTKLEAEATDRPQRRRRIPELLAGAEERLEQLKREAVAPGSVAPPLFEVRRQLATARADAIENEIAAYQAELASFDTVGRLLRSNLDNWEHRVARGESRIEALRKAVASRRQEEGLRDAERARLSALEAESMPASVQGLALELARQNLALAAERTGEEGLPTKIDKVRQKLARAKERVAKLDGDYERLTQKVEAAGLTDSVGLLLRKQRAEIPDTGKFRRFIRMRQEMISAVQLEQIEWRDQRRQLANINRVVKAAMSKLDDSVAVEDRARIEALLRDLLETKRQYLDSLISDYDTYFEKLVDFDARQQELIEGSEELLRFIDERILWIPSSEVARPTLLSDTWEALAWLFSPRFSTQLARALRAVLTQAPLLNAATVLAFISFLTFRSRIKARLSSLGEQARKPNCIRDALTWEACGLTLLLAPWWPGLLGYVGWQLSVSPDATQYVRCVAHAATVAALVWVSLEVPRQLLRRDGIVDAHFSSPVEAVRSLHDRLTWLTAIAVPAVFVIQVFELRGDDPWRESVGRITFVVLTLAAAAFLNGALRESRGAVWAMAEYAPDLAIRRWVRRLAHIGTVAIWLLLAAAAVRGYYWTAIKLSASFHLTLVFLFLLLVVFRLFVRWSTLARRRLALDQLMLASEARPDDPASEGVEIDLAVDLETVDAQTTRLIRSATFVAFLVGMSLIWADLLPAVGILREVELWSTTAAMTVETTNAAGELRLLVEDRILPVTLADVFWALILAVMTFVLVRNLPGFLEITIFRRLAPGERYAYATLAKYGVSLLGISLAFNTVGVGWSNIQWLVAAVGLGLGFGLQEIFANFVSGLIILFERPIRVGDTVTVGNISGVVSRIRIRATWITGFDRKELVVPNKEFVTTQLVNWSLSDAISRVEIRVGIAYGSDTEKAIELLQDAADANPDVLRDPAPSVLFRGFGDSSLDFELRAFSPDMERRLPIVHALHMAIDRSFRTNGIEIAFPQRDVHLRSLPPAGG